MRTSFGLLGCVAAVLAAAQPAPAGAAANRYISIVISKTAGQEADANCVAYPNTVPTMTTAAGLKQRGIATVTASLVIAQADAADRGECTVQKAYDGTPGGITKSEGWATAAKLRDIYGWKFVSHSKSYADMTTLSDEELRAESCRTVDTFKTHNHNFAAGMFNYPNNRFDAESDAVVASCFAFTRGYNRTSINTESSTDPTPHRANTRSVNGGRCNNPDRACFDSGRVVGNTRYVMPANAAAILRPQAGQWGIAQWYRFVTASRAPGHGAAWDCRSTNPRDHWTSDAELYCLNDFFAAVGARDRSAVVTHPAAMAALWRA
ncbi:MAG: hypothetical protein QOI61_414 [Actinomycetota bacterium]